MEIIIAGHIILLASIIAAAVWYVRSTSGEKHVLESIIKNSSNPVFLVNYKGEALSCLNENSAAQSSILDSYISDRNICHWLEAQSRKTLQQELIMLSKSRKARQLKVQVIGDAMPCTVTFIPVSSTTSYMVMSPQTVKPKHISKLEDKVKLMEMLLDNLPIPASVKDMENRNSYLVWNQKSTALYDTPQEKMLQGAELESILPTFAQIFADTDREVMQKGEINGIHNVTLPNGENLFLSLHKKLLTTQNGKKWIISAALDVTEQETQKMELEKKERELQEALKKASQMNRLKTEFIAHISHEVRTPLNAIVGFCQYLVTATDEEEKEMLAKSITENADNLVGLITGIMELAQIETGERTVKKENFNLHLLISEIANGGQGTAGSNVATELQLPDQEFIINADRNALVRILGNFMSNAIKFTESGSIAIGYTVSLHSVRLFVRDTGIGIDKARQEAIFDRFEKNGSTKPGIGLGLTICKALAHQMGATIGLDSKPGQGSTFWLEVPAKPSTPTEDGSDLSRFYSKMK